MSAHQPAPGAPTAWPGFDVERTSVRVVLLDPDERLLLFATIDPLMPETGTWWELPGGGMEAGESIAATAVREIAEETGFVLHPDALGPPRWHRHATYLRRGVRVLQHEYVLTAPVPRAAPVPAREGRTPEELAAYVDHRWWTVAEIVAAATAGERFFPGRLAQLLAGFLAGEVVDEAFEQWN